MLEEMEGVRRQHSEEVAGYDRLVQALRERVEEVTAQGMGENEFLKMHLAVMRQADISSLKDFYENSMQIMGEHIH